MFDGSIVKKLLKETGARTSDLSEALYGNRKRSISGLLSEKSNPTASTLEVFSKFFGVPIDYFFTHEAEEEDVEIPEKAPITVYLRAVIAAERKTSKEREARIKNLETIVALREAELAIYKKEKEKE